jgi:hypothetical protein
VPLVSYLQSLHNEWVASLQLMRTARFHASDLYMVYIDN